MLTFSLGTCFAQQNNIAANASRALTVDIVQDAGTPLQIIAQTSTVQDQLKAVTVQNVTDKEIVGFEIGWISAVPSGCGAGPGSDNAIVEENTASRDLRIPPQGTATANEYAVSSKKLLALARDRQAVLVSTQIAVTAVSFADGSSWRREGGPGIFSPLQLSDVGKKSCRNGLLLKPAACKGKLTRATLATPVTASSGTGVHYICGETLQNENCANVPPDNQSCSNSICKDIATCAMQRCELVIDNPK
jgi:hypothetical protein